MDRSTPKSAVLGLIRALVKDRLKGSRAYNEMPKEKRDEIAFNTVNALNYILSGENGEYIPQSITLAGNHAGFTPAGAMAGAASPAPGRPTGPLPPASGAPAPPGGQQRDRPAFGDAAREGGDAFTDVIADVNFPQFVGGLIDGVFNSIVTTSIKQMEAYAEMVKNVSKSVDQYMKDNVTENNARDYLADRYPNHLEVDIAGDQPRLKPKEGYDEDNMPDFFADLGLKSPMTSLDDDNVESELVPAARRRIAMDRQQLLATMVMMGVNRLVVTNGTIEASCMFELDTTDARTRSAMRTTTADWARERSSEYGRDGSYTGSWKGDSKWTGQETNQLKDWSGSSSYSGDYKQSWFSKGASKDTASFKMTTVSQNSNQETIDMHAQLTGKVKVNFKSDYFPMEKMVDVLQINQIRDKTQAMQQQQAQAALPPPPPPPPMPALPAVSAPAQPAAPPAATPGRP
jgi:hypothetical protein